MRIDELWYGEGGVARAARGVLLGPSWAYGTAMRLRRRLYDAGILASRAAPIPTIGVGNLTVGGTGKTPFSAWLAARIQERAAAAIVLRGYGDDEPLVHERLNPAIPVVVDRNRLAGVRRARELGAEVAVLDDAFQHRRLARTADVVLVSVEQLLRGQRVLPAGPWREPLSSARLADVVVLTSKVAGPDEVAAAVRRLQAVAPAVPIARVRFAPAALRTASGATFPLERVRSSHLFAIAAIGEPDLFRRQLEDLGARVTLAAFRDHHRFTEADILRLTRQVPADAVVVCTLKDAVKLASLWPAPDRLWYVSQQLVVEQGAEVLDGLLERALEARSLTAITAG